MIQQRTSAQLGLTLTSLAVVYAVGSSITGWAPSYGWLLQSLIHLGELAVVLALATSGVAGPGRPARLGLGAALLGQFILAVAECVYPVDGGLGDVLFSIGPVLTAIGLITAGAAVLRTRRLTGWQRYLPVAVGGYTLVALIPAMAATGGPPAVVALIAIAGWDVLWALTAIALLQDVTQRPRATTAPATPSVTATSS